MKRSRRSLALIIMALATFSVAAHADWMLEKLSENIYGSMYYDICFYHNYLIAAAKRAVEIYSLENPADPVLVAQLPTPGLANGVAVQDDYLYVGDVYDLLVVDLHDIANPTIIGSFYGNGQGFPERLRVRGNYLYVAAYDAGLQVYDVTDKTHPVLLGAGDTPAYAWYIDIEGNLAAVADTFSVEFFDISDPRNPINVSSYTAMFGLEVTLRNGLAYIAFIDGMTILDLSDPTNPTPVGGSGITGNGVSQTLTLNNNLAYVGHQNYLDILDISSPASTKQIGYYFTHSSTRAVRFYNNYIYIAEDEAGFEVVDVTDPRQPQYIKTMNLFGSGQRGDVTISDTPHIAYLADGGYGVRTIDYSDPANPQVVGGYNTPGSSYSINKYGDQLLVGDQREIEILSTAADPLNPAFVGRFRNTGNPIWATAENGIAYVADSYSVQTVDLADPANPVRLDAYFTNHDGTPYRTYKKGNYLYVPASSGGLMIFNCSDPSHLSLAAHVPQDHSKTYTTLGFTGYYVYAPDSNGDIDIYDVSNPNEPSLLKTVATDGDFPRILIDGQRAFLSNQSKGISVLDISDPLNPRAAGYVNTTGYAEGIALDGDLLLVADVYSFQIYRITETGRDTTAPITVITSPTNGQRIEGKYADVFGYAIDPESGVKIVEVSTDQGQKWNAAQGQTAWSYRYYPLDDGLQVVLARSTDRAGNVENPPAAVSFPFNLLRSMVYFGGYWSSYLPETQKLTIMALVADPVSASLIDRVEIYYDGMPTGVKLDLASLPEGQYALFQAEFAFTSGPASSSLIELAPFDSYGNPGFSWPYLTVK